MPRLFLLIVCASSCLFEISSQSSCDKGGVKCLDVFTHLPANIPKCYCTELCSENLEVMRHKCGSGQLHVDGCGTCLVCAKALNEPCGGNLNVLGSCAAGLTCLVKFDEKNPETQRQSAGRCVRDDHQDCFKSGVREGKKGVNCRQGRVGILAEALYCPAQTPGGDRRQCQKREQTSAQEATTSVPNLASTQRPRPQRPPRPGGGLFKDKLPTVAEILGFASG